MYLQGLAVNFRQLQKKFTIAVPRLEKGFGVNVSIAKTANFMMNILLFQVLRSENTVYSCFGVEKLCYGVEHLMSQSRNSSGVLGLQHQAALLF